MKTVRRLSPFIVVSAGVVLMSQGLVGQTQHLRGLSNPPAVLAAAAPGSSETIVEMELLQKSREAGLLTDWHLEGRFGRGSRSEINHRYAPEKEAQREAGNQSPMRFVRRRYEMVFPEGTFALPPELATLKGIFYAVSSAYLGSSSEWNVYLESGAEAVVFVDGVRVLTRGAKATGALRGKVHLESGYHSVMVKFLAQAAPFRVAILPPSSGSRRKNNTPYMQASPAPEDMLARALEPGADESGRRAIVAHAKDAD